MKKIILALFISLGIASAHAQSDSSAVLNDSMSIQPNDMVCFLTDENTITCLVMPGQNELGEQEENRNIDSVKSGDYQNTDIQGTRIREKEQERQKELKNRFYKNVPKEEKQFKLI